MSNSDIRSLVSSYQAESVSYSNYQTDSATASIGSSITKDISRRAVYQDSNGNWVEETSVDSNVFKTAPELKDEYYNEPSRRISNYSSVLTPLDQEILTLNNQINDAKSQITSLFSSAVSLGCSYVGYSTAGGPLFGSIPIGDLIINSVTVGSGLTVYGDLAQIKIYSNIYDSNTSNPFEVDDTVNLSTSNISRGYQNVNTNNGGSGLGIHRTVLGITTAGIPNSTCSSYASQIDALATSIASLRTERDRNVSKINDLKNARVDDEISDWVVKKEQSAVIGKRNEINSIINTLQNTNF